MLQNKIINCVDRIIIFYLRLLLLNSLGVFLFAFLKFNAKYNNIPKTQAERTLLDLFAIFSLGFLIQIFSKKYKLGIYGTIIIAFTGLFISTIKQYSVLIEYSEFYLISGVVVFIWDLLKTHLNRNIAGIQ